MNTTELYKIVAGLDERLVERADNALVPAAAHTESTPAATRTETAPTARRNVVRSINTKRLTLAAAIAVAFVFTLAASLVATALSRTGGTLSGPGTLTTPVTNGYIFLKASSLESNDYLDDIFESADEFGLCDKEERIIFDELIGTLYHFPELGNKEFKYSYSKRKYQNYITKQYGKHYSVYDFYKGDNGEQLAILHGTDLVCYFFDSNGWLNMPEQFLNTEESAKKRADYFLSKMLPDTVSSFENTSVTKDTTGYFSYIVYYARPTLGQKTDENISIYLDMSGSVIGYNGFNIGKYEKLKHLFNEQKIEQAKIELTNKIYSLNLPNMNLSSPFITTDADGNLFVRIDFSYEDEHGFGHKEATFINVN